MFGSIKTNPNSTENKIFRAKNNIRSEVEAIQKLKTYNNEEREIITKEGIERAEKRINELKVELKELGAKSYEDKTFFMEHVTFKVEI